MSSVSRIFIRELKNRRQFFPRLQTHSNFSAAADVATNPSSDLKDFNRRSIKNKTEKKTNTSSESPHPPDYRFIYQEFLPNPTPSLRNAMKEKIERKDMLARRTIIDIPEFYVGSILAVTHSEPHAPGKSSRFVGICIFKDGCGMRASFMLRNVVDGQPVEIHYDLYDPCIQKIDCLRLEKRLDDQLLYLRDCALEYSTVPFDLEPEFVVDRKEVPVNRIKVPLLPPPWISKYELLNLKGVQEDTILNALNANRTRKLKKAAAPWEKYDLMKMYRKSIPEDEQREIYSELYSQYHHLELSRQKQKRSRVFARPMKTG